MLAKYIQLEIAHAEHTVQIIQRVVYKLNNWVRAELIA